MNIKEQYWRYSLIAIILLLWVVIFRQMLPFLSGLLGACTLYVLLRKPAFFLTEQKHWRKWIMAVCLLLGTILFCLIPIALVVWFFVSKIKSVNLDPQSLLVPVQHVADLVRDKTGYDILDEENISTLVGALPKVGQILMGSISSFLVNVMVLLLILYFMLTSGRRMENYVKKILPFNRRNKRDVLHELYTVVRSNAIGVPVLAVLQGGVAMLGYYLFGVPEVLLWGVISC
ncbi:MAG: AI-2E family transporter, partial [Odoribacter sp.]|nr:AI-2E family transporter [Odoribacter sp.]